MSKSRMNKRWLLWLPLLGVAMWLGLFADKTPIEQISPSKTAFVAAPKASAPTAASSKIVKAEAMSLDLLVDRSVLIGTEVSKSTNWRNLFVSSTWTPPVPPLKPSPPITTPVPTPTAPAFPFQFVGKKLEDNAWEVYLSRGDQSFLVREGGTLEGTYRIDNITPQRLTVTYLPLGQSQSLSIGESQ